MLCQGTTVANKPCKNHVKEGVLFCHWHRASLGVSTSDRRPSKKRASKKTSAPVTSPRRADFIGVNAGDTSAPLGEFPLPPEIASYITFMASDLKSFCKWMMVSSAFRCLTPQQVEYVYQRLSNTKVKLEYAPTLGVKTSPPITLTLPGKLTILEVMKHLRETMGKKFERIRDNLLKICRVDISHCLHKKTHGQRQSYFLMGGAIADMAFEETYQYGVKQELKKYQPAEKCCEWCYEWEERSIYGGEFGGYKWKGKERKDCAHHGTCFSIMRYNTNGDREVVIVFEELDNMDTFRITPYENGKLHGMCHIWKILCHSVKDQNPLERWAEIAEKHTNTTDEARRAVGLRLMRRIEYRQDMPGIQYEEE
jgi:hypothetical protein